MFAQIKYLYTADEVRRLDRLAIEKLNVSEFELMQRAGQAAFAALQRRWPRARNITVLCGKGNNAGDGYIIAHQAHTNNLRVKIVYLCDIDQLQGAAREAVELCIQNNIPMQPFDPGIECKSDILVDALLGTGLRGEVDEEYRIAIECMNNSGLPILAVDLPSGLIADSGTVAGVAVKANLTVTFIGCKRGFFTGEGMNYCGEVLLAHLDIPNELLHSIEPQVDLLYLKPLKKLLPKRSRTAHKGYFGAVLVVGGDYGMPGSVRMAAEAAARVGAGLVTVATRPEHVAIVSGARPELMCYGVNNAQELKPLLARATMVVVGPGLGRGAWGKELLTTVFQSDKPKLIDADGLNLLSGNNMPNGNWILTPHPGEAGRLLEMSSQDVQQDRYGAIQKIVDIYGGVCVLKGAGTLVCGGEWNRIGACAAGNPGMASGGMGDLLSGIIAGLVAQGIDLSSAARMGVLLHAKAADLAALDGGERGLLATDLMVHLRKLVNNEV
ncbi:MAG: NAD(P)H-hydrate dehydratase [Gammaproteobacteria bacterium]|nr:NAD(P)H-hydrate dehydratase [Gammaproteobacteria bacterium]